MPADAPPAPARACVWNPLPEDRWDSDHARHLLRRAGWSAQPDEVARAVAEGLPRTLDRLFPAQPPAWPAPPVVQELWDEARERLPAINRSAPAERQRQRNELRQRSRAAAQDMAIAWLQHARAPQHAAVEKWLFFLSDIYVTAENKVRNAWFLHRHQDIIRQHAFGPAPALTQAVSRSPAMIMYLDLQGSRRDQPNENFARELFELFVLGEGHYTETDIKEAARAFVGYRQVQGEFRYFRRQADPGRKTVFGQTGRFDGDDIIDLAYCQPAARTFLPGEMARFYLTAEGLDDATLSPLGDYWHAADYDLRALIRRFFSSELFYAPEYRGNFIKSPVQFTLGLHQDLDLDILPLPRFTLNGLRGMGQLLYEPPNVRGWVGGQNWINSTTLTARRNVVNVALHGVPERLLNADETAALDAARDADLGPFALTTAQLERWQEGLPAHAADRAIQHLLPGPVPAAGQRMITNLLRSERTDAARGALQVLLSLPDYNLC